VFDKFVPFLYGTMPTKTPSNMAFGRALVELRKAAGLTQDSLAERADLDRTFVSLLERGLRSPSFDTLLSLGRGLSIPAPDLVARAIEILASNEHLFRARCQNGGNHESR
jgi:transcriptional regulator with XRE-family HTH domain